MQTKNRRLLSELINGIPYSTKGPLNGVCIRSITADSKKVREGDLFVAIRGARQDGHHFLEEAIHRGAMSVIVERPYSHPAVKVLQVSDTKKALSHLAAAWYQFPSSRLRVIGVTGTNGKTTTTYLLEQLLQREGVGIVGTINYRVGGRIIPAPQTTPGALELQALLSEMVKAGLQYAVLEVSSHALDQSRAADVAFETALFTNLTQDHLDYHGTLKAYGEAKLKLFSALSKSSWAIVNVDDPFSRDLIAQTKAQILRFGFRKDAQVRAESAAAATKAKEGSDGMKVNVHSPQGDIALATPLFGRHNVYNLLAAFSVGIILGKPLPEIAQSLGKLQGVPGRLEKIDSSLGFQVFVDYAHTPDAMSMALAALREVTPARLWVVFGCGGDRDQTKRPQMGRVAAQLADDIFLTTDNPRSEDPQLIIDQILEGIRPFGKNVMDHVRVETDRASAIREAIFSAQPGDTVLLAGKGHESYQIFKNLTIPFDDRQQARHWIAERELKIDVSVG